MGCDFVTITGGSPFDGMYPRMEQIYNGQQTFATDDARLLFDEVWYFIDSNGNAMVALMPIEFDGSLNSWAYNSADGNFGTFTATTTCSFECNVIILVPMTNPFLSKYRSRNTRL